jgi:two-component system chemotaxis sensor kinase CheA
MDDLLQEFIAETRETLEALSGEIVAWEASPDDRARLDAIFRFVHTVKGSCGFLDLPRLARLSHAAEDVLAQVRSGERVPDRSLVNAVLGIVDRIGEIVEAIDAGNGLDDSGEDLLIAALAGGSDEIAQAQIAPRAPTRSVRLNVELLDRMMSGMSDMVLARNELSRRLREDEVDPKIEAALERLSATVAEMRDTVTRTRMQKIDALFSALPRMVRDTAAGLGKAVTLQLEGADVELDREMIEVMRDPLVHIIRNAIDHGIESPSERLAAGKRENGRLTVAARQSGNQIVIEITDDGKGIDGDKLVRKMIQNGSRDELELRALSEKARLQLIFEPGLSIKDEVSEISGRGVGMDVVRACVEQIGGRVELDSTLGKGLRITIHVPLTLSIIPTIVVGVGAQRFAIPRQAIEEIVTERGQMIRIDRLGDSPVATVRDRMLPLVDLGTLMGLGTSAGEGAAMLAIVNVVEGSYALMVESVLDNEELVIKPASPAVMSTGLYAGQTLPDSGRPMLVLDCAGVAAAAGLHFKRQVVMDEEEAAPAEAPGLVALLFLDLDGTHRAIPLSIVDRVEPVDAGAVRFAAGRLRIAIDGAILPLATQGPIDGFDRFAMLRLKDGSSEIGYAIAEALDIVTISEEIRPAAMPGPVCGVVLVEGEPVELLDPLWLFATYADDAPLETPPLCLLEEAEGAWMATFLKPMLEGVGYRVVSTLKAGETADVVMTLDAAKVAAATGAPVVRLRSNRASAGEAEDDVYRYDRAGVLAALKASTGGRG